MIPVASQVAVEKTKRILPLDADGFVVDPALWSPGMARVIARQEEIRLTPEHWAILHELRKRHLASGAIPPAFLVCRCLGLDRKAARRLFGSCRTVWRIAGLPYPGEEVLAHMG